MKQRYFTISILFIFYFILYIFQYYWKILLFVLLNASLLIYNNIINCIYIHIFKLPKFSTLSKKHNKLSAKQNLIKLYITKNITYIIIFILIRNNHNTLILSSQINKIYKPVLFTKFQRQKIINLSILHKRIMSILIDIQQQSNYLLQQYKQRFKQVISARKFNLKHLTDDGKSLTFHFKASKQTYRLATIWRLDFACDAFKLQIMFYNSVENDLLRAYTDRMKIQLTKLINIVNIGVVPYYSFLVQSDTGLLKLISFTSWTDLFTFANSQIRIENMIYMFFQQLKKYDELIMFVEPAVFDTREITEKDKKHAGKINRLRTLLKSTKNTRKQIEASFKDIIALKQQSQQLHKTQIAQIGSIYMKNVTAFQKSIYGLENTDIHHIDPVQYHQQLIQAQKNQSGYTNYQPIKKNDQKKKRIEKIIFGLCKIQPEQDSVQKICSQQGAHSRISRKNFNYIVLETVHIETVKHNEQQWANIKKTVNGQLTYKNCKKNSETSINSFLNQLKTLKYLRDMYSPFVARYFLLMMKKQWDQNDTIYMSNYRQDVHHLIQNCTALSMAKKLQLSYQIAKGLCFLYSKKVIHRDFKPQNIVVDKNLVPKIIDFGSSISHYKNQNFKVHERRLLTTQSYNIQYYRLPNCRQSEMVLNKYTKQSFDQHPLFDVYGFGKTLSYIFFNSIQPPVPQVLLCDPNFQVLENIIFLIRYCVNIDPDDRPSFGQLTAFLGSLKLLLKQDIQEYQEMPHLMHNLYNYN